MYYPATQASTSYDQSSTYCKSRNIRWCFIFGNFGADICYLKKDIPKMSVLVLVHLHGKRVYRKFPSTEPPILENTENITPPKISASTVFPTWPSRHHLMFTMMCMSVNHAYLPTMPIWCGHDRSDMELGVDKGPVPGEDLRRST